MGYILDGKAENISGKRLTKIASGKNGDVYKYKNSALKIFREGSEPPIDAETAKYLKGIQTSRILLPRKLLFYNNTFKGYTYKLVPKKGAGKRMIMLPKDEFIGNIALIERDIELLSQKHVLLDGIDPTNYIFNGDLYITDPSGYTVLDIKAKDILDEIEKVDDLEKLNKFQLHLLITSIILAELRKINIEGKKEIQLKELLELKDENQNSSDFFADIINDDETVKQLIRKI